MVALQILLFKSPPLCSEKGGEGVESWLNGFSPTRGNGRHSTGSPETFDEGRSGLTDSVQRGEAGALDRKKPVPFAPPLCQKIFMGPDWATEKAFFLNENGIHARSRFLWKRNFHRNGPAAAGLVKKDGPAPAGW